MANETATISTILLNDTAATDESIVTLNEPLLSVALEAANSSELANITEIASQLLTSTLATLTDLINDTVISANESYSGNSTHKQRIMGAAPAVLAPSGGSDLEAAAAASGDASADTGSGSVMAAWMGLGILLVGIVFILGFVFVYDRIIRKRFSKSDPEEDAEEEEEDSKKDTEKGPGPLEPGQSEFVDQSQQVNEAEKDESPRGSKTSLNANRKRQEKQDETNQVELKPL